MQGRADVDAVLEETPWDTLREWVAYWQIRDGAEDPETEMTTERAAAAADLMRRALGSVRPIVRKA
jgi:hypothetical protein